MKVAYDWILFTGGGRAPRHRNRLGVQHNTDGGGHARQKRDGMRCPRPSHP